MDKLNINEVAKLAYVSRSVVSRVLNGQPHVSEEARERVMRVIQEYNYRPSHAARSLVTQRSYEVCMVSPPEPVPVRANGFWSMLVTGVAKGCSDHNYHLSVSFSPDPRANEPLVLFPEDSQFDGYIVFSKHINDEIMSNLMELNAPLVLVEHHPAYPQANFVMVDNIDAAQRAVAYLISLGHRSIALIEGRLKAQVTHDRRKGYRQALEAAGLAYDEDLILKGNFTEESGYAAMQKLLKRQVRPTAVFCMSDGIAIGALLALYDANVSVPEEMSVMGFGGYPRSKFTVPPLTTIRQPVFEMGKAAAELLIEQVESEMFTGVVRELPAPLIVRKTCAPPRQ